MSVRTCLAVMYHYVRDSAGTPFPAIRALAPPLFERQLDWLQERHTIVDVAELDASLDRPELLPSDAAVLTFDDGFIDHFDGVLPILRARGLTGVFFLAEQACGPAPRVLGVHKTHFLLARLGAERFGRAVLAECEATQGTRDAAGDAARRARVFGMDHWEHADERPVKELLNYELPFEVADRVLDNLFAAHIGGDEPFARGLYLSETMIRAMAGAGMTFGYHTRSHRMLSRLSVAQQDAEVRNGVQWIRSLTGQRRVPFCYPWGGPATYTADTRRLLEDTGYSLAFNTVRRRVAFGRDGRFELPRIDTRDLPPFTDALELPRQRPGSARHDLEAREGFHTEAREMMEGMNREVGETKSHQVKGHMSKVKGKVGGPDL